MPTGQSNSGPTVATIGNFDGVHLGHQSLLREAKNIAQQRGAELVLITFCPHPRKIVHPELPHRPLSERDEREQLLSRFGNVLELPFDRETAALTPEEFVVRHLLPLNISVLVIGHDFALGKGAAGDFDALKALGCAHGFEVRQAPAFHMDGEPVSSTRLRKCLENGDVRGVAKYLGRPYNIRGKVTHGFGRGQGMGFPTANINSASKMLPSAGVYATIAEYGGRQFRAITNIGSNPTFNGQKLTIETFLLDVSENLYGQEINLLFIDRIRPEIRFSSAGELTAQIEKDIVTARAVLAEYARSDS